MRKLLTLPILLSGCDGPPPETPVQTATLTGLYRSGDSGLPSQLCIVARGGDQRFGLVTRRDGMARCSGAGSAVRRGDVLRLTMAGEGSCTIDARIRGTGVSFPSGVPPGCAYYCAPGASFARLRFEKTGGTEFDASRARDLVGDALCS